MLSSLWSVPCSAAFCPVRCPTQTHRSPCREPGDQPLRAQHRHSTDCPTKPLAYRHLVLSTWDVAGAEGGKTHRCWPPWATEIGPWPCRQLVPYHRSMFARLREGPNSPTPAWPALMGKGAAQRMLRGSPQLRPGPYRPPHPEGHSRAFGLE